MNEIINKNFPVFIVGMPRSGTTLVSNIINASNQIYIPEETHYFVQKFVYTKFSKFKQSRVSFNDFYLNKKNYYIKALNLNDEVVSDLKKVNKELFFQTIINSKLERFNEGYRWGEKTPLHFLFIKDIFKLYPKAKIVHIIRDPRDVFCSMRSSNWYKIFPFYKILLQYKKAFQIYENNNKNVLTVKYEDVLKNTVEEVKKIYKFCDLEFNNEVLENFHKGININFSVKNEPWKKNNLGGINSSNTYKWKLLKNDLLVDFIGCYLKDQIKKLGYSSGISMNFITKLKIYFKIKIVHYLLAFRLSFIRYFLIEKD